MNYRINVYSVKDSDSNVKAYANVAFGESFVVRNIAVVEKKDSEEVFVAMPSYRSNDVGRILRTFKIKKNVEVTDNGKIII